MYEHLFYLVYYSSSREYIYILITSFMMCAQWTFSMPHAIVYKRIIFNKILIISHLPFIDTPPHTTIQLVLQLESFISDTGWRSRASPFDFDLSFLFQHKFDLFIHINWSLWHIITIFLLHSSPSLSHIQFQVETFGCVYFMEEERALSHSLWKKKWWPLNAFH